MDNFDALKTLSINRISIGIEPSDYIWAKIKHYKREVMI